VDASSDVCAAACNIAEFALQAGWDSAAYDMASIMLATKMVSTVYSVYKVCALAKFIDTSPALVRSAELHICTQAQWSLWRFCKA
jgi:hypothetical protein